jgi:hypothetical protein
MRSLFAATAAVLVVLVTPAAALAAPTPDFLFEHAKANYRTSLATTPGAYQEGITPRAPCPVSGPPCTYEAHEFEITPDQANGAFSVTITWGSEDDDWDLFVYKVLPGGTVDESSPVAKSAQGGTTEERATLLSSPDRPIEAGKYRIYVDNWAAADPSWKGVVQFEAFVPGNKRPNAALTAPASATTSDFVALDASGSSDPDGTIENYAWDLNGDGRFELDGGSPQLAHKFPAGRRHVSVRVRDNKGGVDFATQTINVAGPTPPDRVVTLPPPPGSITISVRKRQSIAAVALRGVAARLTCPTACKITGRLTIGKTAASRLRLGSRRTIATQTRSLSGVRSTPRLRLKPRSATLRALRRALRSSASPVVATVRVTVASEGYTPKSFVRRVAITR